VPTRILILLTLLVCSLHALAAVRVDRFESSVLLGSDGAALVNETITLAGARPEFVRTIPLRTSGHADVPLIIRVLQAEDEHGVRLHWNQLRDGDTLTIHLQPRTNVIRLTYLVRNAAVFGADHDELRWPATDPNLALEAAEVRIALPRTVAGDFKAQAFTTSATNGHAIALWSSTGALPMQVDSADILTGSPGPLPAGVVITVGAFLHKGVITPPGAITRAGWYVGANRIVLLPLVTLLFMLALRRLRPMVPRSIVAVYEPPASLTPAEIGTLIDDTVDPRDIAATLADLAVRGFVRFDAITASDSNDHQPDFKITLLRPQEDWSGLAPHEHIMLFHSFYGGHWTQLSSLKLRFPAIVPLFRNSVMSALQERGFYTWLRFSPWILCQVGFWVMAALLFIAQSTGFASLFDSPLMALGSAAISAVIIFVFGGKLSSKSRLGRHVWAEVRGFQEFLDRVDADRMQRLTPDLYEKYLPYAMALGVERGWTAAFDDIAVPVPDWFGSDGGLVDPSKFHDSLHAFVEHTLHEISNRNAPRLATNARSASAN
jgi:Predicted membrane protein (DUF2207)